MRLRQSLNIRSWAARLVEMSYQDMMYAVRGLSRSPGMTAAIILTLGLGVGANAAIFSALDRVFFQAPPGVTDPDGIWRLYAQRISRLRPSDSAGQITPFLRTRDLLDLQQAAGGTAQLVGYDLDRGTRLEPSHQQVRTTFVSPGYFEVVGVRPALGRFFAPDENRVPGPPSPAIVISDAYWRHQFASAPDVVGKTLRVDETTYTIVGVAPPDFEGLELEVTDLWAPLNNVQGGDISWLRVVARVEHGRDPGVVAQRLTRQYRAAHLGDPDVGDRSTIITAPILASRGPALAGVSVHRIPGMSERSLALLTRLAGVGFVVALIAIANVASLLLMRAMRRQREIAVRLALGISRTRLLAQLVTESVILAVMAGAAALAAASGAALNQTARRADNSAITIRYPISSASNSSR
jgi:putative ABC transport system permease protein